MENGKRASKKTNKQTKRLVVVVGGAQVASREDQALNRVEISSHAPTTTFLFKVIERRSICKDGRFDPCHIDASMESITPSPSVAFNAEIGASFSTGAIVFFFY